MLPVTLLIEVETLNVAGWRLSKCELPLVSLVVPRARLFEMVLYHPSTRTACGTTYHAAQDVG